MLKIGCSDVISFSLIIEDIVLKKNKKKTHLDNCNRIVLGILSFILNF